VLCVRALFPREDGALVSEAVEDAESQRAPSEDLLWREFKD
jgi:hypothetical protein